MEEENRVTLHGMWASPYVKRVEMALRVKGISYDYVEEDLRNKSPLLLTYNPVYKKVPVLVHNGKPIVESLLILEYIDEAWENSPRLLPQDPHQRAKARFWARFIEQQIYETMGKALKQEGEAREKAMEEGFEKMKELEKGIEEFFQENINETKFGIFDILLSASFGSYKVHEEVFGVKLLQAEKNPLLHKWVTALNEVPLVQELMPSPEKLVPLLHYVIKNPITSSST